MNLINVLSVAFIVLAITVKGSYADAGTIACDASKLAANTAINAAIAANNTICTKASIKATAACNDPAHTIDSCNVAQNASVGICKQATIGTNKAILQAQNSNITACLLALFPASTACNAAESTYYIGCNVDASNAYIACNSAVDPDSFTTVCFSPTSTATGCNADLNGATTTCNANYLTACNGCNVFLGLTSANCNAYIKTQAAYQC